MDDVARTLDTYEKDAGAYVEKYLSMSALERYGEAFLDALDGERVLDLGCGPGADAMAFAKRGYDVVGLDATASFLWTAREHLADETATQSVDTAFVRGDMRTLPFASGSVDGIWGSGSFHHVPRAEAPDTVAELRRVLRDGGRLFLSVKREPTGSEVADRHFEFYEAAAFRSLLESGGLEPTTVETNGPWVSVVALFGTAVQ